MKRLFAFLLVGLIVVAVSVLVIALIHQSEELDKPKSKTKEERLSEEIQENIENIGTVTLQSGNELFEIMTKMTKLADYCSGEFIEDRYSYAATLIPNYSKFTEAKADYITMLKDSLIGEWLATKNSVLDEEYVYLDFSEQKVYMESNKGVPPYGRRNAEFAWDIDRDNIFQLRLVHPDLTIYYNIVITDGIVQYLYRSDSSEAMKTIPKECDDENEKLYRYRR